MFPVAMRILVVGKPCGSTAATLSRLALNGWAADTAENLAKAKSVLKMFRLDVVLSEENLPDGRGYDLADAVAQQSSTLLVSVALSESCLWLPVIERGERSLGQRAVTPEMLEFELETILSGVYCAANRSALANAYPGSHHVLHADAHPDSHRVSHADAYPGSQDVSHANAYPDSHHDSHADAYPDSHHHSHADARRVSHAHPKRELPPRRRRAPAAASADHARSPQLEVAATGKT